MWLPRTHNVKNVKFPPGKTYPSPRSGKSDSIITPAKPLLDRCEERERNQHSSLALICCCTGADPRIHLSNIITASPKRCSWRLQFCFTNLSTTEANVYALHFQKLPEIPSLQSLQHWGHRGFAQSNIKGEMFKPSTLHLKMFTERSP